MFRATFLLLCLLLIPTAAVAKTIVLAADKWCPYNCHPKDLHPGFIVEIATLIFKRADINVKYEIMPWSRAIDMAKQGIVHGIVGATKDEVPDFVFPQYKQGSSATAFFVRADETWRYNGMASLKKVMLGVIQDYDYGENMNRYIAARQGLGVDMITGDNATQVNINKLYNRRVTTILEDPIVLAYQVKQLNLNHNFIIAGTIETIDVYIAFSPEMDESKQYAKILDKGMTWLRKTDQLKRILDKYGIVE